MDQIEFITYEQLLELHREQLGLFGGADGIIDDGVVRSALAQPSAMAFGEYLHEDIAHMAAAYLFHFAASQGFVDGNKRTAVVAAITFLGMNGFRLAATEEEMYAATISLAVREWGKTEAAESMRERLEEMA